jgi:hypothetical protein
MTQGTIGRCAVKRIGAVGLALFAAAVTVGASGYRLEDIRTMGDAEPHHMAKVVVVGIADDREVRNRFEDKLASNLTARGLRAIASHTVVPSLTALEDRERILATLEKEGVEGAVTVRAVGLDELGEKSWVAAWEAWIAKESTIRQLIERAIPLPPKRAKRYGIEFALWDARPGRLLWAARTGTCARKDLQSGVSDLLQLAIDGLKDAHWL